MREALVETICNQQYTIQAFGGMEGLKIAGKLTKTFGPVLAPMLAAQKGGLTPETAKQLGTALVEQFDVDTTAALVFRMTAQTTVEGVGALGNQPIFDKHFSGNFEPLIPLLSAIITHNFSGFFAGLGLMGGPDVPAIEGPAA